MYLQNPTESKSAMNLQQWDSIIVIWVEWRIMNMYQILQQAIMQNRGPTTQAALTQVVIPYCGWPSMPDLQQDYSL